MPDIDVGALFINIIVFAIPVLLAITLHEAAHGYAARHFGDPTAAALGRITLNPLKHIDLVGTIIIPIVLLILTKGAFAFGYAKPVPVNFAKLQNPKKDMLWVALAGPATNFIQAFIWALLFAVAYKMGLGEANFMMQIARVGITVNLVLCVLNLFFIPPLDGGRILVSLLPYNLAIMLARVERYGFLIVIGLLYVGILNQFWIAPLVNIGFKLINWVVFLPLGLS